jgi:hypothetical protein
MFTARYALSPYIKQIRFVFKGLNRHLILIRLSYLSDSDLQICLNMCHRVSMHLFTHKIQKCETHLNIMF